MVYCFPHSPPSHHHHRIMKTISPFHVVDAVSCPTSLLIVLGCFNYSYVPAVMNGLGWNCTVIQDLGIDINAIVGGGTPRDVVSHYASEVMKALERRTLPSSLMVSCATVVDFQQNIRLKPTSKEMAHLFLSSYSGSVIHVITGLLVKNTVNGKSATGVGVADIHFGKWNDDEGILLDHISRRNGVMNAPGALDLKDRDIQEHIEFVDGTVGTVLGLPIDVLCRLITEVV